MSMWYLWYCVYMYGICVACICVWYVCKCVCEGVNAHMYVQEHCLCLHVGTQGKAVWCPAL